MGTRKARKPRKAMTGEPPPAPAPARIDPEDLLQRSLRVIDREVRRYEAEKAWLDTQEARALVDYTKALRQLVKDARDVDDEDAGKMTDDELLAAEREILKRQVPA